MYTVNWATKVVSVPKADLTLVSASPEVYELDVLQFWSQIHDIQDGEGMPYVDIMRSNAPVVIAGQTYVRTVEVINGYTVEFEDGQYQVNLTNANNNLSDVRVPNQVSISSSNSAGAVVVDLPAVLAILEGDQEHVLAENKFRIKDKVTKQVLVEKNVSGSGLTQDVTLTEP